MSDCTWKEIQKKVKSIGISEQGMKEANIVLFGARMNGGFAYDRWSKIYKIVSFADNYYVGSEYKGIPVITPDKLKDIENLTVIITVTGQHYSEVRTQLNLMNIKNYTYAEFILVYFFEKFEKVYDSLLDDEYSKRTYRNLLWSYLETDDKYLKSIFVRNQYFELPEFCIPSAKDVYVDCGAYVGDTMEAYIVNKAGVFKKIYAFEPTEKSFVALCYRKEHLIRKWALDEEQIIAEKKAVSNVNKMIAFAEELKGDRANRVVDKSKELYLEIQSVTLDSYFKSMDDKPTFIKADVEGSEGDLIQGAEQIIRENKPRMAVCIYHKLEDLFEIPIRLKELNPEYKMSIRHHLPNYHETVLYCY